MLGEFVLCLIAFGTVVIPLMVWAKGKRVVKDKARTMDKNHAGQATWGRPGED